jgi:secondary thiamine-phosphate synthase enzyme
MDPATAADLVSELHRLVPTRVDFKHIYDTPADAAGHIKATLVGASLSLIVSKGELILGSSQSILFFEFDGPRARKVLVQVLGSTD